MDPIPRKITELADRDTLTQTELDYRHAIDLVCTIHPIDLENFIQLWNGLEINLGNDVTFQLDTGVIKQSPLEIEDRSLAMCKLDITRNEELLLRLKFVARDSQPDCASPIVLSNTRVKPNIELIDSFNPYEFYDSLIYLLHKLVPAETELSIFVRQRDTLSLLEAGNDVNTTPLFKIFTRAGWNLIDHIARKSSRKYPHILSFENT